MNPAALPFDLWASLDRAGTSFLALDESDCLMLEKPGATGPRSAQAAQNLSTLGSLASDQSVCFLNQNDRVEALVDLSRNTRVQIDDFSEIRALVLAPDLSHRLGSWTRQKRRNDGLWTVELKGALDISDSLSAMLEQQILRPWAEDQHHHVIYLMTGDMNVDLFESGAKHHRSLAKVHGQLNDALVQYFTFPHHGRLLGEFGRGKSTAVLRSAARYRSQGKNNIEADLPWLILTSIHNLEQVQNDVARTLDEEVADTPAHAPSSVEALVSKIESATETVDAISQALSSATAADTARSDALVQAPQAAASVADPIQNAIEIRQRLMDSVNLVDAAKWAKWRGAKSKNPSAALGKYKNQHRVFAVRAGNRDLYPAFQFSENAEPLPIIEKILKVVPEEAQGWSLLSWFEAENVVLAERKPSALVSIEPSAVLSAAERFYSRED